MRKIKNSHVPLIMITLLEIFVHSSENVTISNDDSLVFSSVVGPTQEKRVVWRHRRNIREVHQMSVAMTDPWDERYIYLHENHTNQLNVGEYTSPMDPMGYDTEQK